MKRNLIKGFYQNLFADCKRKTTKQLLKDLKGGVEITFNKNMYKKYFHNKIEI